MHINVNDDQGQSWSRDVDVTADADGNITDSFNLPDWFVATYAVKATGASGAVATANFTDADTTTTTLQSSLNPSALSQSVTFTAKVLRTALNTAVTVGSVKFGTGGNCTGGFTQLQAGQTPNASGEVTYTTSTLPSGTTTIRACYVGTGGSSGTQDSFATLDQAVNATQDQTITFAQPPSPRSFGDTFNVAPTASSGLAVSVSASGGCTATVAGGGGYDVTMTSGTNDCVLTASQGGNASYNPAANVQRTVQAQKANQTITVGTPAPASAVYDTSFTVAATASSGLAVSYSSTGVCSNVGPIFTMTSGTGTCTVEYNQAGNNNYNAAAEVTNSATAAKANQATLSVTAPSAGTFGQFYEMTASGGSGDGALSFSVVAGSTGCAIVTAVGPHQGELEITNGSGTCKTTAHKAGNANYNPADSAEHTVTVSKANQTITVGTPAPASAVYDTSFTVAATASSGLAVSYSSTGVCSNVGPAFTMTSGTGSCTVKYNQAGNTNYNAAPEETADVTAEKADQATLSVTAPSAGTFGQFYEMTASGGNGTGALSFDASGSACEIPTSGPDAGKLAITSGTGTCKITAHKAGDDNYNPADSAEHTVTVSKANQTITVDTAAPASAVYDTSFTVAATASSGLAVSYSSTGVCSNVGPIFTMTSGTGSCTVKYNQAGNANYNAAAQITEDVTAEKADQTITLNGVPATKVYLGTFTPSATSDSGLTVAITRQRRLQPQQRHRRRHDDQRHRHLHRARQPGRQRQLQRRPRRDGRRHSRKGRPDDHAQRRPRQQGLPRHLHAERDLGLGTRGRDHGQRRLQSQQRHRRRHDDQRHRHLHRARQPGRQRQLQRSRPGHRRRHGREGEPDDHRRYAGSGERGLRHLVHGRRDRQLRARGQLQQRGRLLQRRPGLHDDQRHRHLHRRVQPGRQHNYNAAAEVTNSATAAKAEPGDAERDRSERGHLRAVLRDDRQRRQRRRRAQLQRASPARPAARSSLPSAPTRASSRSPTAPAPARSPRTRPATPTTTRPTRPSTPSPSRKPTRRSRSPPSSRARSLAIPTSP